MNFVAGFPSLLVFGPSSFDPNAILNSRIDTITIGNKNGKRIPGTPDNAHHNTRISVYVDDGWRMKPNFTLRYGLRYEVDTHPLNNDLNKPTIVAPVLSAGTAPTPINKKNFSPSLGFAWDPTGGHKTSIRGGFGLYYAMRISNLVTNERASLAPFNSGNDTIALQSAAQPDSWKRNFSGTEVNFTGAITGTVREALPIIAAGQAIYVAAPP
jgi:outer membrane receptor protein involved in Fe transport